MSEKQQIIDLKEIIRPKTTPEMGFESYKMLVGDKDAREQTKKDFIAGTIYNPTLDYPKLDIEYLTRGVRKLQDILTLADDVEDWDERTVIWNSAAYRIAEMYYLKNLAYLLEVLGRGDQDQTQYAAQEHQRLNESLYSRLTPEMEEMVFGEAYAQIKTKKLTPKSQKWLQELQGFETIVAGVPAIIPPAPIDSGKRLPQPDFQSLDVLKSVLQTEFPEVFSVIETYDASVIQHKPEDEREFTPQDMLAILQILCRDKNINVIYNEGQNRMSWDTEEGAIVVGGRRKPIKKKSTMLAKVMHEYGIHANRYLRGSKSELAVLGTGLFSAIEDGDNYDYLTFEEGFASAAEYAVTGDKVKWDPVDLEKAAAIALVYRGFDFRQTYEALWRLRCLMNVKDGEDLPEKSVELAKRNAYDTVERIFRGTPSDLSRIDSEGNPVILCYSKDLAYLSGKLLALDYLQSADESAIRFCLRGKFDPTNPKQLKLAQKYISPTLTK